MKKFWNKKEKEQSFHLERKVGKFKNKIPNFRFGSELDVNDASLRDHVIVYLQVV